MNKLIGTIFFLQLLLIFFGWGMYANANVDSPVWVEEKTGLQVNQTTPEGTVVAFYELLGREAYDGAHRLLTPASREAIDVDFLRKTTRKTRMEGAELAKVFPAMVKDDLALVGHIRLQTFKEESAIVGISVLMKNGSKWEMVRSDELEENQARELLKMALELEDYMLEQPLDGFNEYQKGQIERQIKAMQEMHHQSLEVLEKAERQEERTEQVEQETSAEAQDESAAE
ncbi:hypothetical protein [Calderihabitans maritimus]|uniref:Uncharacterized protein n=1 Tax=Calderihabitans maritimus TaxID=1246530 RepID=A0A1Z5HR26_9FIRM|nr:hypothetical protein [Calderihabitans maritimus]GAW91827.1 hypothetical protein KKC1_09870 [Calderihabitans maritimus]